MIKAAGQISQALLHRWQNRDARFAPDFPEGLPPQLFQLRWFAKAWNYGPDDVRALELDELDWAPTLEEGFSDASETLEKLNNPPDTPLRH